jgi:hypothetical protein
MVARSILADEVADADEVAAYVPRTLRAYTNARITTQLPRVVRGEIGRLMSSERPARTVCVVQVKPRDGVTAAAAVAESAIRSAAPAASAFVLSGKLDGTRMPEIGKIVGQGRLARMAQEAGYTVKWRMVGRGWIVAAVSVAVVLGVAAAALGPLAKADAQTSLTSLPFLGAAAACALIAAAMAFVNKFFAPGRRAEALQAVAADLAKAQEQKPEVFRGFAAAVGRALGETTRHRVVIVNHFERLDALTKAAVVHHLTDEDPREDPWLDYWIVAESAATGDLGKTVARASGTRRSSIDRVFSQDPLTPSERADLAERLGRPDRAVYSTVGAICSDAAPVERSLADRIERQRQSTGKHRAFDAIDLLALLAMSSAVPSGGPVLHRGELVQWMTSNDTATAALLRSALPAYDGDGDTLATLLGAVLTDYAPYLDVQGSDRFSVPRETAEAFVALAARLPLPEAGVCHALWSVWSAGTPAFRTLDGYWVNKVAEHLRVSMFRTGPDEPEPVRRAMRAIRASLVVTALRSCTECSLTNHLDELTARFASALGPELRELPTATASEIVWAAAALRADRTPLDVYLRAEAALSRYSHRPDDDRAAGDSVPIAFQEADKLSLEATPLRAEVDGLRSVESLSGASQVVQSYHWARAASLMNAVFSFEPDSMLATKVLEWFQLSQTVTGGLVAEIMDSELEDLVGETSAQRVLGSVTRATALWDVGLLVYRMTHSTAASEMAAKAREMLPELSVDDVRRELAKNPSLRELLEEAGDIDVAAEILKSLEESPIGPLVDRFVEGADAAVCVDVELGEADVAASLARSCELTTIAAAALACTKAAAAADRREVLCALADAALRVDGQRTGQRTADPTYEMLIRQVDRQFGVLGVALHVLGADGLAWELRLRQLQFRTITGVHSVGMSQGDRIHEVLELSSEAGGLTAVRAAAWAASLADDSKENAAQIYLNMTVIALRLGLGEALTTTLCVMAIALGTAYDQENRPLLEYLTEPGRSGEPRLRSIFEATASSELAQVVLAFCNATLNDAGLHSKVTKLAMRVIDSRPDDSDVEAARRIVQIQDLERQLDTGEVGPGSAYAQWRDDLDEHPFVLYLILRKMTGVDDVIVPHALGMLERIAAKDFRSAHVFATLQLHRLYTAAGDQDGVERTLRILEEEWRSIPQRRLSISANVRVLLILSNAPGPNAHAYQTQLAFWLEERLIKEDLGTIARMMARGDFFGTFAYYCRVLEHFGLSATNAAKGENASPAPDDDAALAMWLAEGGPQIAVLVRDPLQHELKVNSEFLQIGHALFDGPASADSELDMARETINELARHALPLLLRRALDLELPPRLQRVLGQHLRSVQPGSGR